MCMHDMMLSLATHIGQQLGRPHAVYKVPATDDRAALCRLKINRIIRHESNRVCCRILMIDSRVRKKLNYLLLYLLPD